MATLFVFGLKCTQCFQGPNKLSTSSQVYSCSVDGTVLAWDVSTLRVTSRFQLPSGGLSSLRLHGGRLWCCKSPVVKMGASPLFQGERTGRAASALRVCNVKIRCLLKLWPLPSLLLPPGSPHLPRGPAANGTPAARSANAASTPPGGRAGTGEQRGRARQARAASSPPPAAVTSAGSRPTRWAASPGV